MKQFRFIWVILIGTVVISACTTIDLYEKNVTIPSFKWKSSFQPEFDFTITDTSKTYDLYLVLRHNEKYNFNNIWINLYSQPPGDTLHKEPFELTLATNEKGWLGTGLDDIWEHRIRIIQNQPLKAGNYHFKLQQIMREDPLENVLSAGLRLEKH